MQILHTWLCNFCIPLTFGRQFLHTFAVLLCIFCIPIRAILHRRALALFPLGLPLLLFGMQNLHTFFNTITVRFISDIWG